jgi:hypothetical protein
MKRWSGHRIRAVLVALVVALGMSFSVVQGGPMAAGMVCGSAAHALLTAEPMALPAASEASFQAVYLLVNGLSDNPDPGPPKTLTFG